MSEKQEEFIEETSDEIEDLRRYIEEFTAFLPLAFCMVNPLDFILDANQSFQTLTGYEKMEVIGSGVDVLFKNKKEIENFKNKIPESDSAQEMETILTAKDGKSIFVRISALSRRDDEGNFSGYFLTITDITETKRFTEELEKQVKKRTKELEDAKERLEESEAVLEVKVKARTREFVELNERLEDEVKKRTKELEEKANELTLKAKDMEDSKSALLNILEDVDQSFKETERERRKTSAIINNFVDGLLLFDRNNRLSLINPKAEEIFDVKSRDIAKRTIKELVTFPTLKPVIKIIGTDMKKIFRKELEFNEDTFLEITTIPVKREGKPMGILVTVHDITREKRIERIKSEFVSVAAHQLRTPLSGIKWTLRTILDEAEDIPEEQVGFIQKAYDANERMVNLVNDLLNVTRIEEGRYIYKPEEGDLMEVVRPIIDSYAEKIKEKGLKFEINEPPKRLPGVKIDKEKIGMIVQNFLDNAMKYTKKGKVVLDVKLLDSKVKISVTDSGVGIPEDQQERLFNKFFRAANVMRMETEGSGLGLFIAKNIVEAHGGEVGFTSKEGEGSTFFFTLPVGKSEVESFIEGF